MPVKNPPDWTGLERSIGASSACSYHFSCLWSSEPARCEGCTIDGIEGDATLVLDGKAPPSCPYRMRQGERELCRCPVRFELYRQHRSAAAQQAGLLITSTGGEILSTNSRMEQLSGLARAAIIGAHLYGGFAPGLITNLMPLYHQSRSSLAARRFDGIPATAPDGSSLRLSGWLIPLAVDGSFERMIWILDQDGAP